MGVHLGFSTAESFWKFLGALTVGRALFCPDVFCFWGRSMPDQLALWRCFVDGTLLFVLGLLVGENVTLFFLYLGLRRLLVDLKSARLDQGDRGDPPPPPPPVIYLPPAMP